MALIEIRADLRRTADALERIASSLEALLQLRLNPAVRTKIMRGSGTVPRISGDAVSAPSDEDLARAEEEEQRLLDTYGQV